MNNFGVVYKEEFYKCIIEKTIRKNTRVIYALCDENELYI